MTTLTVPATQSQILSRSLDAQARGMSADVARFFLAMSLSAEDVGRVNELSAKARLGTLSTEEEGELQEYLRHGRLMEVLQLRARSVLA
jgi:hypothetical protein